MILLADRIITGDGKTVLENTAAAVSEQDGKILAMGTPETLQAQCGGPVLRYPGCTLLPGLVDLHVHLSAWGNKPFGYAGGDFSHAYITLRNARNAYRTGVTTIRSVADKNGLLASLVWAAEQEVLDEPIPRIIPCGNGISIAENK